MDMFLEITGFLTDDSEDSSTQFELDVQPEFEKAIRAILGWESLAAECDGELPLTEEHIRKTSSAINEQLPMTLDMFIGVRA